MNKRKDLEKFITEFKRSIVKTKTWKTPITTNSYRKEYDGRFKNCVNQWEERALLALTYRARIRRIK